jgi:hypothetical protein
MFYAQNKKESALALVKMMLKIDSTNHRYSAWSLTTKKGDVFETMIFDGYKGTSHETTVEDTQAGPLASTVELVGLDPMYIEDPGSPLRKEILEIINADFEKREKLERTGFCRKYAKSFKDWQEKNRQIDTRQPPPPP